MAKYPIPFTIATKVRIVKADKDSAFYRDIGRVDIIQEVTAGGENYWEYSLCKTGAWFDHDQLEKISDPTDKTIEAYFKALEDY